MLYLLPSHAVFIGMFSIKDYPVSRLAFIALVLIVYLESSAAAADILIDFEAVLMDYHSIHQALLESVFGIGLYCSMRVDLLLSV